MEREEAASRMPARPPKQLPRIPQSAKDIILFKKKRIIKGE